MADPHIELKIAVTDEKTRLTVIYAGRRPTVSGKVGYLFLTEEMMDMAIKGWKDQQEATGLKLNDAPTERLETRGYLWGLKPKDAPRTVGAIYSVDSTKDEHGRLSIFPASFRFERQGGIDMQGMVTAWEAMDRSVEQEKRMKANEAKYDADPAMKNAIEVIRHRYQRTPHAYRRPLFLWLLDQLEKR